LVDDNNPKMIAANAIPKAATPNQRSGASHPVAAPTPSKHSMP
jgi:hypothetical protein